MDTVTVSLIIRLTGLLVFAPQNSAGNMPVHVLMPQITDTTPHFAQLGYRGPNSGCAYFQHGICYINLDGLSLEIGRNVPGPTVALPHGASNVSNASGRRVLPQLVGPRPDATLLRSRITLNQGAVSDTCSMGRWEFEGTIRGLHNVVEWTVPDLPSGPVELVLKSLDGTTTVRTLRLTPNNAGEVELYVRHVTRRERDHNVTGPAPALGDAAHHFDEVYKLFGAPHENTPVPVYRGTTGKRCGWIREPGGNLPTRSPGTVSCMVSSGTPG